MSVFIAVFWVLFRAVSLDKDPESTVSWRYHTKALLSQSAKSPLDLSPLPVIVICTIAFVHVIVSEKFLPGPRTLG